MELMMAMAEKGLQASVSDAGVGALCARTGAIGAYLNVKINCVGLEDEALRTDVLKKAEALKIEAEQLEGKVMAMTLEKI